MKIAVTGASGHLGNVICRILLSQGHEVRAMYNHDKRSLEGLKVEHYQGDVLDPVAVNELVEGREVVIHCAAIISIYGDPTGIVFKTNAHGPKNVLEACVNQGVRKLLHVSSSHAVMERPLDEPFDETRPYKQAENFAYDYSKATGEQIMLDAFRSGRIDGCVLRPTSVVGLYDVKPSEMGKALIDFYNRKIPMLPQGGYDFVDVRDVANSIVNAIELGRTGEIYLLSGKYYSLKQLAQLIHKVSGVKTPKMVMPFWFLKSILPFVKLYSKLRKAAPLFTIEAITALKLGHPNMRSDKAQKELEHHPRPLEETIQDFYDWQIKQGTLKPK